MEDNLEDNLEELEELHQLHQQTNIFGMESLSEREQALVEGAISYEEFNKE